MFNPALLGLSMSENARIGCKINKLGYVSEKKVNAERGSAA